MLIMKDSEKLAKAAAYALSEHNYGQAEELYRQAITMVENPSHLMNPNELDVAHYLNTLADQLAQKSGIIY
jgi:hypothetical protein